MNGARKTLITFHNVWNPPGIDNPGFAEPWLATRNVNAIYFTCAGNDWYQYPDMPEAIAATASSIEPGQEVLCYGLSMGAYAAIRFSGALGADRVLAFAPQYCISPERAPFETRWRKDAHRIRFIDEPAFEKAAADLTIIYDPLSLDRFQVAEILARNPAKIIKLRHAGHKIALILSEMKLLSGVLSSFVERTLDGAEVRAQYRARRKHSTLYMRHLGWAGLNLARRARIFQEGLKMRPRNKKLLEGLAYVELKRGNPVEAQRAMKRAGSPKLSAVSARHKLYQEFMKQALYGKAMGEARAIIQMAPELASGWLDLCNAAAHAQKGKQALEAIREALRLEPDNLSLQNRSKEVFEQFMRGVATARAK